MTRKNQKNRIDIGMALDTVLMLYHKNDKLNIIIDPKMEVVHNVKNSFYLTSGELGIGRAVHPWDDLKKCSCGGYPYMVGADGKDFCSGSPYKVFCTQCLKSTVANEDISIIKKEWNEHCLIPR
ncbi:MAG: hypothetical protein F8N38_15250 [Hungatella sp.]|nr:hypothetical protein [Hungatella sp.]